MYIYLSLSISFFLLSLCFNLALYTAFFAVLSGCFWTYFWLMFKNQKPKMPPLPIIYSNTEILTSERERRYDDCEREEKK
jgi:hypothetical protein